MDITFTDHQRSRWYGLNASLNEVVMASCGIGRRKALALFFFCFVVIVVSMVPTVTRLVA